MSLFNHAFNIITKPKTEWEAIKTEQATVGSIFTNYVAVLALIPVIATFVSLSLIGIGVWGFTFKYPIGYGIVQAVAGYIIQLLSVYITALVFNALAKSFGSTPDMIGALKLVAFSMTPYWICGIFGIYYALSWLAFVGGIYGLVLLYMGLTPMMGTPADKKVGYFVVSIIVLIVVMVVVGLIINLVASLIMPNPLLQQLNLNLKF
jgi:hypothetical protein